MQQVPVETEKVEDLHSVGRMARVLFDSAIIGTCALNIRAVLLDGVI